MLLPVRAARGLPLTLPFAGVPERDDANGDFKAYDNCCVCNAPFCLETVREEEPGLRAGLPGLRAELHRGFLPTGLRAETGLTAEMQRGFLCGDVPGVAADSDESS